MTVKALIFDVFGTLLDWRTGVGREAERLLRPMRPDLDGPAFALAWRARYGPGMAPIRDGTRPYVDLDVLHAESLDAVLDAHGLADCPPDIRRALVLAWHRLDAWPEVPDALAQLRTRFILAPCSNAPIAMSIAHARQNRFPWDAVLGAGLARDYKPKPAVYRRSVEALGLLPDEVVMVAAHSSDLAAAAENGLRTAHVARPLEYGQGGAGEPGPSISVDYAGKSLAHLAGSLL